MSVAHDIQAHRGRRIQSILFGCLKVEASCDDAKAQGVSACSLTRLPNAKVLPGDLSSVALGAATVPARSIDGLMPLACSLHRDTLDQQARQLDRPQLAGGT